MDIELVDPIMIAIPVFVILVIAELIYARTTGKASFEPKDSAASLVMGLGNTVSGVVLGFIAAAWFLLIARFGVLNIGYVWWAWILCFVADDFIYYWSHRWAHTVRWFWADHVVHHSSQHYNLTTALRQPWFSVFTLKFMWLGSILILIGFPPGMVAFVGGLNLIYQFWIHTEAIGKMPRWFEAVMNTPSHHRVHHATNPRYLDRNYAGVFIVWDKMFGTFEEERADEACRYGIVRNLGTYNPLVISLHEWWGIAKDVAGSKSPKDALGYIFAPPGWSPDGSRLTSKKIKALWAERQAAGADDTGANNAEEPAPVPAE
ncbi:sterol desaturase family protein [Hyphobacterium marinum]|uniref:Sterol desaturase family protein n=1 Tax=Hyphobacterium marinum TaxID=3116574 RepID=A0ABU7LYZ5_9PROT|nr:sterol desaturase family protein [Hyphobacterium sp. Y6023]MEE2566779.1 sterol desaturase family protein [Hyphobacterium sp. Y6023]